MKRNIAPNASSARTNAVPLLVPIASRPAQTKSASSNAQMNDVMPGSIDGGRRCIARIVMRRTKKKFTEPVALSSTISADIPLAGTASGTGFVLLALRARCKRDTNALPDAVKRVGNGRARKLRLFHFPTVRERIEHVDQAPKRRRPARRRDQKNSPSRFRFRPPLPLTFPFRVLPSDSVSTYLRSVLGASRTLTRALNGSRGRKKTWPQFAEISFFNISTVILATCGQGCGDDLRARTRAAQRSRRSGNTTRTASVDSSRSSA